VDSLTFALVAITVVALAVLPCFGAAPDRAPDVRPDGPSLAQALSEDLRTGKITSEEYERAMQEDGT
jgi:hypothetical protein